MQRKLPSKKNNGVFLGLFPKLPVISLVEMCLFFANAPCMEYVPAFMEYVHFHHSTNESNGHILQWSTLIIYNLNRVGNIYLYK